MPRVTYVASCGGLLIARSDRRWFTVWTRQFWKDTIERVVWTFLQAFAATLISDNVLSSVTLSFGHKLEIAGIAGLVAIGKAVAAGTIGPAPSAGESRTPATGVSYLYR
jgi:hypothetical protein